MKNVGRFYTLDAMRGAAAILVVLFHSGDVALRVVPGGYLAVDFFFALSGLVIAKAYEQRLRDGLSLGRFMTDRLIRLWPMFILGVSFALVKDLARIVVHDPGALSLSDLLRALGAEVFMMPSPVNGKDLFPLNGPAWSLFFELLINVAFALFMFKTRRVWLLPIVAVGAALVIASTLGAGNTNVGWSWQTSPGGLGRVTFAFTVGVIIHRLGVAQPVRRSWFMALPIVALGALMMLPITGSWRVPFDLTVALLVSPALLILGGRWQVPDRLERACEVLGDLSYPLYAIHFPLLFVAGFLAHKLHLPVGLWISTFMIALVTFAYFLGRRVDPLMRSALASLVRGARKQAPA